MPRASRISTEVETAVLALAFERPTLGRSRVAAELHARGLKVSASSVRTIWVRHGLENESKRVAASAGCFDSAVAPVTPPAQAAHRADMSDSGFALAVMAFAALGNETLDTTQFFPADERSPAPRVQETAYASPHDARAVERETNWLQDFLL